MSSNVRIILVNTYHPGNIGSAARVMKNMGLDDLVLVSPVAFPSPLADQMAAGAQDRLKQAKVVSSVEDAVSGCSVVMACTARVRAFDLPELRPEEAAVFAASDKVEGTVGILFGPERFGLSNSDMRLAQYRLTIPADAEYPSLNLASAVQIVAYELLKASQQQRRDNLPERLADVPSMYEMSLLYEHLQSVLTETGFINQSHPGNIMKKLRRLFDRAEITREELNILRGILASVKRFKQDSRT